jgi:hypothetical protein
MRLPDLLAYFFPRFENNVKRQPVKVVVWLCLRADGKKIY